MKTSSDLYRNVSCLNHADVTEASLRMVRARVIRRVAIDAIMNREDIDVRGELISRFAAADYKFESYDQMVENLDKYEAGIKDLRRQLRTLTSNGFNLEKISKDEDTTVDYFGDEIKAICDFLLTNPATGEVHALKIKTGKFKGSLDSNAIPEAYAIAKYAQGIADNSHSLGYVDYAYILNRNGAGSAEISEHKFQDKEPKMLALREAEGPEQTLQRCSGEDCAFCSMSLICNYEEPAMAEDVMRQVRSAGEIKEEYKGECQPAY